MSRSRDQLKLATIFCAVAVLSILLLIYCHVLIPAINAAAPDAILGPRQSEIPGSASIVTETMEYATRRWTSNIAAATLLVITLLSLVGAGLASRKNAV